MTAKERRIQKAISWQLRVIGRSSKSSELTARELLMLVKDIERQMSQTTDDKALETLEGKRGYWLGKYNAKRDQETREQDVEAQAGPVAGEVWEPTHAEPAQAPSLPRYSRLAYRVIGGLVLVWLLIVLMHGCRSTHTITDERAGMAIALQGMSGQWVCGYDTLQGQGQAMSYPQQTSGVRPIHRQGVDAVAFIMRKSLRESIIDTPGRVLLCGHPRCAQNTLRFFPHKLSKNRVVVNSNECNGEVQL